MDHPLQVLEIPDGTPDGAPDAATPDEVAVGTDPLIENDKTRSGPAAQTGRWDVLGYVGYLDPFWLVVRLRATKLAL